MFTGEIMRGVYRAATKVVLMAFSLCVRQVVSLVHMQCKTKLTLILTQVILHEVRILRQVSGLQSEKSQSLTTILSTLGGTRTTTTSRFTSVNSICEKIIKTEGTFQTTPWE